jgi:hypothetical protein
MSIKPIQQAIKTARKQLGPKLPTFFIVPSDKSEAARTVALHLEMKAEMLAIAMTALDRADNYEQVEYDPDHRIVPGEEVLLVPDGNVNDDSDVYDIVDNLDALEELHAGLLVKTPTKMYGVAFGATADERILFVRRRHMETITADGKLFAMSGGDTLQAVKQPGVIIDRVFDLIVFPEGIVAFDSVTFERLVKDPKDVSAELRANAKAVAKFVPFAPGLLDKLVARGENKPMIRRKFRSIVERNHLVGVTMDEIKAGLRKEGEKPADYIKKDAKDKKEKLDFGIESAMFVLGFLDEGTWRGWRSNTHYTAGGRSVLK